MTRGFSKMLLFAVGSLTPAAATAQGKAVPTSPIGDMAGWFPQDIYPAEAKRAGEQGRVVIRLAIAPSGKPVACEIVESSRSASLDARTCELAMTNGRFSPAKGADGKAIASTFTLPGVRWSLATDSMALQGPWRIAGVLKIDRSGKIISCADSRSGPVSPDMSPCRVTDAAPPGYGAWARGGAKADIVDVTEEASLTIDGQTPLPMSYQRPGREILALVQRHFDIDSDGKPQNCRVISQSGINADVCSKMPPSFLPIGKPVGITMTNATSRSGKR